MGVDIYFVSQKSVYLVSISQVPKRDAAIQYIICMEIDQLLYHTQCCCAVGAVDLFIDNKNRHDHF